ncbi:hypothetical protein COL5a_002300 [Colletotrichum fioriniae]|nr:hypothetical protein COL5a_002300 [Colletotrichum fioriniae]
MAQASPSWQRLLGLLSVLLALILGVSAGEHGAAVTGCPADLASAPEHTFLAGFDNSTDVAETQAERSHVGKLAATSLHGMGMFHLVIPCVLIHILIMLSQAPDPASRLSESRSLPHATPPA